MYPTPSKCPVCGETLTITKLHCPSCDTGIEGRFEYSRLEQLQREPPHVRRDVRAARRQAELGGAGLKVSYPTVRSRLDEVIRAMGYAVKDAPPAEEKAPAAEQRQTILDDLAAGKISPAEAIKQLQGQ